MKQLLSKAGMPSAPQGPIWNIDFCGSSIMELLVDPDMEPKRELDVWSIVKPREESNAEESRTENAKFTKKRAMRTIERDTKMRKENRRPLPAVVMKHYRRLCREAEDIIKKSTPGDSDSPKNKERDGILDDTRENSQPAAGSRTE